MEITPVYEYTFKAHKDLVWSLPVTVISTDLKGALKRLRRAYKDAQLDGCDEEYPVRIKQIGHLDPEENAVILTGDRRESYL